MKKKLLIFVSSLFIAISSFSQNNPDSIINLLKGEWELKYYFGGICGCKINADNNNIISFEKHSIAQDSINYNKYYNNQLLQSEKFKLGYTPYTSPNKIYGWYIENFFNGQFGGNKAKAYISINDTALVITPDPQEIIDGMSSHYSKKKVVGKGYTLQGQVNVVDNLWDYGKIYLYEILQGKAVDSVNIINGKYLFSNVLAGEYTLYVIPYLDSSLTQIATNCLPTFYVNKATLEEANTFEVNADTYGVDFKLRNDIVLSNNELNKINCKVYPNPFVNNITIDAGQSNTEIRVINIEGVVIHNSIGNQIINLNTESWKKGVYIIEIRSNSSVTFSKIIKN